MESLALKMRDSMVEGKKFPTPFYTDAHPRSKKSRLNPIPIGNYIFRSKRIAIEFVTQCINMFKDQ
ncbi:MAG: hypothetical protein AABY22_34625, partial [Nanoarchaeota archaeon]